MTNINKIEDSLNFATEIGFHPTPNYEKEPPAIVLGFDDPSKGSFGYDSLFDTFKNSETTLIIFEKQSEMEISIVSKKTGDAINVKGLKFDAENFKSFIEKEDPNRKFILLIGYNPATGNQIVATRQPFSPLVIDKYEISKQP